ncbi:MAG: phosphoenolpyruvate--protein phosphotransferase [Opitutales bacterium]
MSSVDKRSKELMLFGIPASPGIAHGPVFRFLHQAVEVLSYQVEASAQEEEISRFMNALEQTKDQVRQIRDDVAKNLGEKEAGIFDAHMLVLEDKALIDDVCKEVKESGDNVEQCVYRVTEKYQSFFEQLEDQYLRERASDLRDISSRLLRNLAGATSSGTAFLEQPKILVSEDLTPSDTASLDRSKILGIATNSGGQTSHAVIMARASGVPAVVGLRRLTEDLEDGDEILIDGFEGVVIINPSETTLYRYGKVGVQRQKAKDLVDQEASLPAETLDGSPIKLWANADTVDEISRIVETDSEGVGLYRTESLFLRQNALPSEDEQYEEYAAMVKASAPKPITIRTLDLGGDKILDAWAKEQEENPFMGFRAIRYCLSNPPVFLDQLRAILRASAHGKVKILLPMISGLGEVTRAKEFIFTAKRQLSERGQAFDQDVEVGCMLETPAAVAICDLLATEVDFFSVGTNDLVQYLLAVDRVNNRIAFLYEPHHPAVIRSLKSICQVTSEKKKPVTVCGEIAGDPHFLPLLLGLGLNSFSASVPLLPELKFFARRFTMEEAQRLTRKAERLSRPSEVKELLKNFYEEKMAEVGK